MSTFWQRLKIHLSWQIITIRHRGGVRVCDAVAIYKHRKDQDPVAAGSHQLQLITSSWH